MARHIEPLDKGLVTIRDPGLLKPGELSYIRNAIYLPGSNALQRARGREVFGTATASAVDVAGLRDMKFDNGNHYLLAHVSASYVTALVGDTGTFGTLVSGIGVGTQLENVQYRNRYYLMNGVQAEASAIGSNRVVYLSATAVANTPLVRQHGMLPVVSAPSVTTAAGTFSQTVTGYYEYWTTEVAKVTQDGASQVVESGFSAETGTTTVLVTNVGQVPTVQMPPTRNEITTHWRIYRSPKKEAEADKKFPTGFMIAEMGTATATQSDSLATASASSFPSTYNTVTPYHTFTNRTNLGADDGAFASAIVSSVGGVGWLPQPQAAYGYNLGGFSGSVKGIEVELQAYISSGTGNVPVYVSIGTRASDGNFQLLKRSYGAPYGLNYASKSANLTATNPASPQTVVLGSPTDRWFASDSAGLVDTDFDSNFMTVIVVSRRDTSVGFDYIKARVYYGSTVDSVVQFPAVVYTFGDQTFSVDKNGPPPSSSTGAMFQDCLVVNDLSNPAVIRWSFPGDPEAFPSTYFLDFETRENDRVRFIGTVNNRLIVGLDSSLWRVNYLPSERDATFDRGNAVEPITRNYGIVNPMCACVFSTDGLQERLAFVSHQGVHSTDGFNLDTYSANLDWRGDRDVVGVANTAQNYQPVALINDRERQELLFYFRNDSGGGGAWFALHFQYNELIENKPRVSGYVTMENLVVGSGRAAPKSAWAVPRDSGRTDVYIGYGTADYGGTISATSTTAGAGRVYRETGTTISSPDARMQYQTRRMFLAGMGNEWRLNEVYGYCGLVTWAASPGTVQYAAQNRKTNSQTAYTTTKTYSFGAGTPSELLHKVTFNQVCEGVVVTAVVSGEGTYAQEYIVLDGEDFGVEDSGT